MMFIDPNAFFSNWIIRHLWVCEVRSRSIRSRYYSNSYRIGTQKGGIIVRNWNGVNVLARFPTGCSRIAVLLNSYKNIFGQNDAKKNRAQCCCIEGGIAQCCLLWNDAGVYEPCRRVLVAAASLGVGSSLLAVVNGGIR